jgi:hypothetical protein
MQCHVNEKKNTDLLKKKNLVFIGGQWNIRYDYCTCALLGEDSLCFDKDDGGRRGKRASFLASNVLSHYYRVELGVLFSSVGVTQSSHHKG